MAHFRNRTLTIAQQLAGLEQRWRGTRVRMGHNRLECSVVLRPSPVGREYRLLVTQDTGGAPKVFVQEPDLVAIAEGRRIPHVYSQTPLRLCLWLPSSGQWKSDMLLADTVVPWAVLWLWYFEDWLMTGEWSGGGQHPSDKEDL